MVRPIPSIARLPSACKSSGSSIPRLTDPVTPKPTRRGPKPIDAAWAQIAHNFGSDPVDIDNARYALATAVLSIASEESRDVEVLKRAGLQRLAIDYRQLMVA